MRQVKYYENLHTNWQGKPDRWFRCIALQGLLDFLTRFNEFVI